MRDPQIHRTAAGSDMKLRVSLENLLAADQVGRWWIVGSSWSGAPMISKQDDTKANQNASEGQVHHWNHGRHVIIADHVFILEMFVQLQLLLLLKA